MIWIIRDDPTQKIDDEGITFSLRSRDYKGAMVVVISESNRPDNGKDVSRILRSGCLFGYVHNGDKE